LERGDFRGDPQTILKEIELHLPRLHEGLTHLKADTGTRKFENVLEQVYERLDSLSLITGSWREPVHAVIVVPATAGGADVGSWESLYD